MNTHTTVLGKCLRLGVAVFAWGLSLMAGLEANGAPRHQGGEVQPPGSLEIFDTLNQFWMNKQYVEADTYVQELHSTWSNYVPAELTWAIHACHFGARLEDCIERIQALKALLEKDIELAPPLFVDELGGYIGRQENTLSFYESNGHDRVRRAAEQNPLDPKAKFKPSRRWLWMEDCFYSLVPEVMLGDEVIWRKGDLPEPDKKHEGLSDKELHWLLGVDETTLTEKMAICRELTRRMTAEGGSEKVVRGFLGFNVAYLYPAMIESLMATPDESVPALVAFMDAPINRYNPTMQRKMAIWALVRIGRADEEVMRVLEECRAAHPDDELGDYAARAAEYLAKRSAPQSPF